ncbi:nitroreductase family protein [Peptoniphilus asaccharolyticus]
MLVTNFLQKRKSVRDFKTTKVDKYELAIIKDAIEQISKENDDLLKFQLLENGSIVSEGLKGKAGYGGVMIEAPHYVSISSEKETLENKLKIGYTLEKLNTKIVNLDIDTCWITVDEVDKETMNSVFGEDGERINYLIGFGYGKAKKLFSKETTSSRNPVKEMVFEGEIGNPVSAELLEERGLLDIFSTIIYAPSHKNFQPWRFVLKDSEVEVYMEKSDEDLRSLIDIGVIMFYFEELARDKSIDGKWDLNIHEEGNYLKIASFKL